MIGLGNKLLFHQIINKEAESISPTFYEQLFGNILYPKNTNTNSKYRKAMRNTFAQKAARKLFPKLTLVTKALHYKLYIGNIQFHKFL